MALRLLLKSELVCGWAGELGWSPGEFGEAYKSATALDLFAGEYGLVLNAISPPTIIIVCYRNFTNNNVYHHNTPVTTPIMIIMTHSCNDCDFV